MDEEALEGELNRALEGNYGLKVIIEDAVNELDFAIEFGRSGGVITDGILQGIRKRLRGLKK